MTAIDKFLRKTFLRKPEDVDNSEQTWSDATIHKRLERLKKEAIDTGRVHPIIEFFDSLNVMVYNAARLAVEKDMDNAEANRNRVLEIWKVDYQPWYSEWHESLRVARGDFV